MSPRKPVSPPSAPLGAVAASWLLEACSAATWTADELRALEVAAQSLDRAEKCREQIETEGQTTTNSRGAIARRTACVWGCWQMGWASLCICARRTVLSLLRA